MYLVFRARVPSTRDPSHQESLQHPLSSPPRAALAKISCGTPAWVACSVCPDAAPSHRPSTRPLWTDHPSDRSVGLQSQHLPSLQDHHNFLHIVSVGLRTIQRGGASCCLVGIMPRMVRHMSLQGAPKWRGHASDWNWSCFT